MQTREIDGFKVSAETFQSGQSRPRPQIKTEALDGFVGERWFDISTDQSFRTVLEAQRVAREVVSAVVSVSKEGEPYPLTY